MPCCSIDTRAPAALAAALLATGAIAATLHLTASTPGARAAEQPAALQPVGDRHPADVLHYTIDNIEGEPVQLERFRGRVVMIVNVASRCGLTPQYAQLQALREKYHEVGFEILAFPANDFGNQEPGSNRQIAEFCETTYGVEFPLFTKITVTGDDAHPLYKQLAALDEPLGGQPRWNFTKFLVNRQGHAVARYEPRTRPDAPELIEKLEALLAE
ncbi:MAG: glutathione peroxidase [Phycisphaerales bacterium]|nr:MAG: glutathione peroxidase [Phycisphaerales bacterium]